MDTQSVINIAMIATPLLLMILVYRVVARSRRQKNEAAALQADHEAKTLSMTRKMTETGTDLSVEVPQPGSVQDPDDLEDQSVEAQFNQLHEPVTTSDEQPSWKRAEVLH